MAGRWPAMGGQSGLGPPTAWPGWPMTKMGKGNSGGRGASVIIEGGFEGD